MLSKITKNTCNKQVEHSRYPNLKDGMANNIMKTFANQSRFEPATYWDDQENNYMLEVQNSALEEVAEGTIKITLNYAAR